VTRAHTLRGLPAAALLLAAALVPACSSKTNPSTDTLGDCVRTGDASCTLSPPGGGSSAGNPDGATDAGAGSDGEPAFDAGLCGTADTLLVTANAACIQCIQTSLCCNSDLNCTQTAGCTALLQCVESCSQPGSSTCLAACPSNGVTPAMSAYLSFAQCLQQQCSASCPVLPTSVLGDI
jgi:hypothetical protein